MGSAAFRRIQQLIAATVVLVAGAAQAVTPGEAAPAFSAVDTHGSKVSLSDYSGKIVVLEWTNSGCPFVRKHYGSGNMQKLQKEATAEGVVWLTVVSSAPGNQGYVTGQEADELTSSRSAAPTAVLLDPAGNLGHLYGARTTPHMFVIDPKGTLVYNGAIDSIASSDPADISKADNYVMDAIGAVKEGKAVSHPATPPYGCSVKYSS